MIFIWLISLSLSKSHFTEPCIAENPSIRLYALSKYL